MISDRTNSRTPDRIVVRGTNWVGDTVMSVPALKALRKIFPRAWIAAWAPAGLEPLLRATGVPDEVLVVDTNSHGPLRRPFVMRRALAGGRFDLAVLFQNAFESAFTARIAGIPRIAGYPTDLRGPLLNIRARLDREILSKHQVFYYLRVAERLRELFAPDDDSPAPRPDCSVSLGPETMDSARDLISSIGARADERLICLCPGSVNSEAKRWPADYFAALADLLREDLDATVAFLGAPQEEGLIDNIISMTRTRAALNLAGKTNMVASMGIMSLADMVVSNDTGSAHLAVAAGARVLTLFGPTIPGATAPYGPDARIIQATAPCAPCRHYRCPKPDHPCMRAITPEAVRAVVVEAVSRDRSCGSEVVVES